MKSEPSGERFWPRAFVAAAFAGILFRVALYIYSTGSNDIRNWENFARLITIWGMGKAYVMEPSLNNPPLACALAEFALRMSLICDLSFPHVFKLFSLLADVGTIFLIRAYTGSDSKLRDQRASLCALSVPSILISSFHGNTDAVCVFFVFLCLYFLDIRKNFVAAGCALALAVNIKIIPLLLAPIIISSLPGRKERLRFSAVFAVGLLPLLAAVAVWGYPFWRNVFEYNSVLEPWGINYFLWGLGEGPALTYSRIGGKLIILAVILLSYLQWRRKPLNQAEACAAGISVFLLLAPGFGIQYLIYLVPFIIIVSRQWSVVFILVGGLFAEECYRSFLLPGWPLISEHLTSLPAHVARLGAFTWIGILCFLWSFKGRLLYPSREHPC